MPYVAPNRLIARNRTGFSGLSGFWDVLETVGKGGLDIFKSGEQAKGAAAVLTAQQQAAAAQAAGGGISTTTLVVIGGLGLAAVLLLTKKKKG
jgi:hypothetical protein